MNKVQAVFGNTASSGRVFYGWWVVAAGLVGLPTGPGQFAFGSLGLVMVPLGDEFVWDRTEISLICGSPEDMYPLDCFLAARVYRELTANLPGTVNVACYPYLMNTVVQIEQQYEGHARHVLICAFASHLDYNKTCIFVDSDVDIYDMEDVRWAFLTRGRADTRAFTLDDVPGFYRDPHEDHWGRLAIDATMPFDRQDDYKRKRIPGNDDVDLNDYLNK